MRVRIFLAIMAAVGFLITTVRPASADENFVFYYVFGPSCG